MKKRSARRTPALLDDPAEEATDPHHPHSGDHAALPQSPLSVPELAKLVDMSRSHFAEVFRSQMGCPVLQYSIRLRMQHAAEMILDGKRKMNQIAKELGFRDPLYFSRQFRRVYGVAPTDYRSLKQAGASSSGRCRALNSHHGTLGLSHCSCMVLRPSGVHALGLSPTR